MKDEFDSLNDYLRTVGGGGAPDALVAEITGDKQPDLDTEAGQAALDILQFARDLKRDHGGDIDLGQLAESIVMAAQAASEPDVAVSRGTRVLEGIRRYAEHEKERYSTWTGELVYTPEGETSDTIPADAESTTSVEGTETDNQKTPPEAASSAPSAETNGHAELTGTLEGLDPERIDERVVVALTGDPEAFDGSLMLMQRAVAEEADGLAAAIEAHHGGNVNPNLGELLRGVSPASKAAFQEKAAGLIEQIRAGARQGKDVSIRVEDDRQLGLYRAPTESSTAASATGSTDPADSDRVDSD